MSILTYSLFWNSMTHCTFYGTREEEFWRFKKGCLGGSSFLLVLGIYQTTRVSFGINLLLLPVEVAASRSSSSRSIIVFIIINYRQKSNLNFELRVCLSNGTQVHISDMGVDRSICGWGVNGIFHSCKLKGYL